jgi:serpin B
MSKPKVLPVLVSLSILMMVVAGVLAGAGGASMASADNGVPDELVADNNAFALDLYHAVSGTGDNLILSPYSVSLALAMTYAGAGGTTEQQMAATLHFTLPQDELHAAFKSLEASLPQAGSEDTQSEDQRFRLAIANALWGQSGYPFRQDYLDLVSEDYGAGLQLVDFEADPEAARQHINDWISQQTQDRIQDLLPQGSVDAATRLILTNAIYFKAAWQSQFEAVATQDGPFNLLDGSTVSVPMMSQTAQFGFAAGQGYQAVVLPYEGGRMAMVILLPDQGNFAAFEDALTTDQFNSVLDSVVWQQVSLSMPRFTYESEFGLKDALVEMGMTDAFTPGVADFSGMSDRNDLFISAVVHKAFVKVDESGTEAAAATGVVVGVMAAPAPALEVTIDRPFIYMIVDQDSHAILFMGRVLNPA